MSTPIDARVRQIKRAHQTLMRSLDPVVADALPDEAWAELDYRFRRLNARIEDMRRARRSA